MTDRTTQTAKFMEKVRNDFKSSVEETIKRYPHAKDAMAFFIGASGFLNEPVTPEDIRWAIGVSK